MPIYVVRRLAAALPALVAVATLSFFLINLAPGGPVEQRLAALRFGAGRGLGATAAGRVPPSARAALVKQYGFDRPVWERFGRWAWALAKLDFGASSIYQRPVRDVLAERAPLSLALGGVALAFSLFLSVALGSWMARAAGSPLERLAGVSLALVAAVPAFILGVLLLEAFAGGGPGHWFPLGYARSEDYAALGPFAKALDLAWHAALPLACLVLGSLTVTTRLQRDAALAEMGKAYVRTARAKGLKAGAVARKHVLPNALLPLVSGFGGSLAFFLGGSILVETVFQLNGLGLLALQAVVSRDTNLAMGLLAFGSALLIGGNLLGDLLMAWFDPRVRPWEARSR